MDLHDTVLLKEAAESLLQIVSSSGKGNTGHKHETDELAMTLLPTNPPLSGYSTIKTAGNGNCLFNAVSLTLKGNQYHKSSS